MLKRMLLEAWRKGRGPGRDAASPVDSGSDAVLGWACLARGDAIGAERHARAALAREIDVGTAYLLLAALELPGMYYTEILARIHQVLRPRTYVEIGARPASGPATPGARCSRCASTARTSRRRRSPRRLSASPWCAGSIRLRACWPSAWRR